METSLSKSLVMYKWPVLLGAVGLVVLAIFLLLLSSQMIFQNTAQNGQTISSPEAIEEPSLMGLGVVFGNYNALNGKAGDFVLNKSTITTNWDTTKIFAEFGSELTDARLNPGLSYYQLDKTTKVTSVSDGRVLEVRYQAETDDFAVTVLINSSWAITYDHIRGLLLREDDLVKVGQAVGTVSHNKDSTTGYTEISLAETKADGSTIFHCPLNFLDVEVRSDYEARLKQLMIDWETVYGDTEIYDEDSQVTPGCIVLYFGKE